MLDKSPPADLVLVLEGGQAVGEGAELGAGPRGVDGDDVIAQPARARLQVQQHEEVLVKDDARLNA